MQTTLTALAGVVIRVPEPNKFYVPKSRYLNKDLPTLVSTEKLDLRNLPYDVYATSPVNVETPVVRETLADIKECDQLPYAHPHLFLAGHAFGKTKSLFDIARNRYTILLDLSAQHVDITAMMGQFKAQCDMVLVIIYVLIC